jgi:tetratricopeptide (TPR) repeat protein
MVFVLCVQVVPSLADNVYDTISANVVSGAVHYDSVRLLSAAEALKGGNLTSATRLLLGFTYWRLELIAYCTDNTKGVDLYGKLAVDVLNQAEKNGADTYLTASYKTLVYQVLSGLGIRQGALYGPKTVTELNKAKKLQPQGYYPLLCSAINLNQAPSFAGGNPSKAVTELQNLTRQFPDSSDVKIHLADAYIKTGNHEEARRLLDNVTKEQPHNLLAQKIVRKLKTGKK